MEPGIFDVDASSALDYSNALTFDPNAGSLAMKGNEWVFSEKESSPPPLENFTPRQLLRLAKQLRLRHTPGLAIPIYKRLIQRYPHRVEARWGVMELIATYKEAKLDSAVVYLQSLRSVRVHPLVTRLAGDLLTGEMLRAGDIAGAVANAQQMLGEYPHTESEKMALFDLINIYWHNLGDTTQAQAYLAQLERAYPDDELTLHARMLFSSRSNMMMAKGGSLNPVENKAKLSGQTPAAFVLMQNYPNPFNPSTIIGFTLPEAQPVRLTIYSLSGQEVVTLVDGFMEQGFHQVEWDGKDALGRPVASGIYLYRLKAGDRNLVRKMMLIK